MANVAITVSLPDEISELVREVEEKTGVGRSKAIVLLIKEGYKVIVPEGIEKHKNIDEKINNAEKSKGQKTKNEIVARMKEMGLYEADEVPEMLVRNIISQVAGYDERTIQKYFMILDREMLLPEGIIQIPKKQKNKTNWGVK